MHHHPSLLSPYLARFSPHCRRDIACQATLENDPLKIAVPADTNTRKNQPMKSACNAQSNLLKRQCKRKKQDDARYTQDDAPDPVAARSPPRGADAHPLRAHRSHLRCRLLRARASRHCCYCRSSPFLDRCRNCSRGRRRCGSVDDRCSWCGRKVRRPCWSGGGGRSGVCGSRVAWREE